MCGEIAGYCELVGVWLPNSFDPIGGSGLCAKSEETEVPAAIQMTDITREDNFMVIDA
jgi:hypothetical protein